MAKQNQLSVAGITAAKPKEAPYDMGDGAGLMLRVSPSGAKTWLFKYTRPHDKKRTNIGLGKYPAIGLKDARDLCRDAHALLARGIDPKEDREAKEVAGMAERANTFRAVAELWIEMKRTRVRKQSSADAVWRSFELHVLPKLGAVPLTQITGPMVTEILKPLERAEKLSTQARLVQRINEVMDFAMNGGMLKTGNPCAGLHRNLKAHKTAPMAALDAGGLSELMLTLTGSKIEYTTQALIEWSLHTLVRPSEAAGAKWDEIDRAGRVWVIPAERMKMGKPHSVPLTDQALAVLDEMEPISGSRPYVFPSSVRPMDHIHEQTANSALKRIGFKGRLVSHGLRALGSTTLNEAGFNPDAVEAALSHGDESSVKGRYNRTKRLGERALMMAWWSQRIEDAAEGKELSELDGTQAGEWLAIKMEVGK